MEKFRITFVDRAGRPEQFRIVGVDSTEAGKTKFGLVALVLPKEKEEDKR
jgi:hypothetical protein